MTKPSACLASVSIALGLLCAPAAAKFITFQVPGSDWTYVTAIANSGVVIGRFHDASGYHGYVRAADGSIAAINIPGAKGTYPAAINSDGTIVGIYTIKAHSLNPQQGFIRTPDGQITTFQAPGAGRYTNVVSITNTGWIAGEAFRAHDVYNYFGFFKDPSGHFTKFGQRSLMVTCANSAHTTAGIYYDQTGQHGFVRTRSGKVSQIVSEDFRNTHVWAINDSGAVVGVAMTSDGTQTAFVRTADGTFSAFSPSKDTIASGAWSINKSGTAVGNYDTMDGKSGGGFVRAPDGTITTFTVLGAADTLPESINDKGVIAGNVYPMAFIGRP